jgi:serine/threonine-protein kinase BUR1
MVFPYMEHDLDGLLQNAKVRFNPGQVKSYLQQILKGMEHLHKNLILHRDIKSSNILIDNKGNLKIADFGLARPFTVTTGRMTNMVVTRWYRPPELLMGTSEYGPAIDIWGVGCVFGEILKRRAILPGISDINQLELIWELLGTPSSKTWPSKSYLQYPMFRDGGVKDFDENSTKKTLYEKFPLKHYRKETIDLLEDLLQLDPAKRPTASAALSSQYFLVQPPPCRPGSDEFNIYQDSHELDSRQAKIGRIKEGEKVHLANHHDSFGARRMYPGQFQ